MKKLLEIYYEAVLKALQEADGIDLIGVTCLFLFILLLLLFITAQTLMSLFAWFV